MAGVKPRRSMPTPADVIGLAFIAMLATPGVILGWALGKFRCGARQAWNVVNWISTPRCAACGCGLDKNLFCSCCDVEVKQVGKQHNTKPSGQSAYQN